MKSKLDQIGEELEMARIDSDRLLNKKVKTAAGRLRKRMMNIRNLTKEIGAEALNIKKAL